MKLSEQQQKVVEAVAENKVDVQVSARAGCGKTTTIISACGVTKGKVAFFAFNKAIATELASKAPSHVKVQTLHSLGFSCLRFAGFTDLKIDEDKTYKLVKSYVKPSESFMIATVKKLVGLVKNNLTDTESSTLYDLSNTYGIELPEYDDEVARIFNLVQMAIKNSLISQNNQVIDFDDMIWLPVVMGITTCPKFDYVFVDEAQDMNETQMELVKKVLSPNGHICFVGDKHQAIYAFRGADVRALDTMTTKLQQMGRTVIELPLNKTRRCPKKIVELAQKYVPDFEAMEDAPEGIVRTAELNATPGDMVLCRMNAPLIPCAYALLRAGIPVKVQGRDIGAGLQNVIKKINPISIDDLIVKLSLYRMREAEKLKKSYEDKPSKLENAMIALDDKVETLQLLASEQTTIDGLIDAITDLFSDVKTSQGVVLLSTIHKAKGMESGRVWWIQAKEIRGEQEDNLKYVAITRAKNELIIVQ
jgi:superfamily I DNA/RNA helicase